MAAARNFPVDTVDCWYLPSVVSKVVLFVEFKQTCFGHVPVDLASFPGIYTGSFTVGRGGERLSWD